MELPLYLRLNDTITCAKRSELSVGRRLNAHQCPKSSKVPSVIDGGAQPHASEIRQCYLGSANCSDHRLEKALSSIISRRSCAQISSVAAKACDGICVRSETEVDMQPRFPKAHATRGFMYWLLSVHLSTVRLCFSTSPASTK